MTSVAAAQSPPLGVTGRPRQALRARVARRGWNQAVKLPGSLVSEFQEHTSELYQAWMVAKPKNDSYVPRL